MVVVATEKGAAVPNPDPWGEVFEAVGVTLLT
jgi:hypothetical protein